MNRRRTNHRLLTATLGSLLCGCFAASTLHAQNDQPAPPSETQTRQSAEESRSRRERGSNEIHITLRRQEDGSFQMLVNGELIDGPARQRFWRALLGPELALRESNRSQTDAPGMERPSDRSDSNVTRDRPLADGDDIDARRGRRQLWNAPGQSDRREWNEELTDDRVREMLAVIADLDAPLHRRLVQAWEQNPDRVREHLRAEGRVWAFAVEMKKRDPQRYALNVQERHLGRQVGELVAKLRELKREDRPDEAQTVRAELRELVASQYDVRQQMRERDLQALEERLNLLREQVRDRAQRKEAIIDEYVEDLVNRQSFPMPDHEPSDRPRRRPGSDRDDR